jgi:hypothetical protein
MPGMEDGAGVVVKRRSGFRSPARGFIKRATINRRLHPEQRAGWNASLFLRHHHPRPSKHAPYRSQELLGRHQHAIAGRVNKGRDPQKGSIEWGYRSRRSSDPEIRQLVTLRTTPDPSGGKVAKLHVPGILRIAEMGGFVVLLQPSAAGVVWHVRSSVASCSCWDGFVFDSSWAINIERSVMSRCDNAQGTSIRSTLVS